jgi:desulfoferrodoxin-like iron-binding protein
MKKRWIFVIPVVFLVAVLFLIPAGCKKKAEETKAAAPEAAPQAAAPVAQESTMEKPFTKDNPGPWAALEEKHLPEITYEKTATGLKVTVKVDNHPMDPQKPHYIMWIKLQDGNGVSLGEKDLVPTDPAPVATFELTSIPGKLKAYEQCNIHGIWMSEADVSVQ